MSGRLAARRALITGAADGIGLAIAQLFAREGAAVVLADFNADKAEDEATALRAGGHDAMAVAVDVTERASVLAMMAGVAREDVRRGRGAPRLLTPRLYGRLVRIQLFGR